MAIRYKEKNGNKYVYETHNKWDKEKKKYIVIWKYLGKESPATGEIKPVRKERIIKENLILGYGDTKMLNEFFNRSGLMELIKTVFAELKDTVLSLVSYKMIESSAMNHACEWAEGNYASILYKNAKLTSQRISENLVNIGNEKLQREFFKKYLKAIIPVEGVLIDSTGLPNEINTSLTAYGHHGNSIEKEMRLLMVTDKKTGMPLMFRYLAGNIVDVNTLKTTLEEVKRNGIDTKHVIIDAGYNSEENIKYLIETGIGFITRVQKSRGIFEKALASCKKLNNYDNFILYEKRGLYIEEVEEVIYEKYPVYCYVCCDITRKAKEEIETLKFSKMDKSTAEKAYSDMEKNGVFVLMSSNKISKDEVLPLYYARQNAEQIFGISKSKVDILPLRVHKEETLRGILFINFLSVAIYVFLSKQLNKVYSVESALKLMRNQYCKVYDNNEIIPCEMTKKQKQIMDLISNTVGKFSGI